MRKARVFRPAISISLKELSTAENILRLLRPDKKYTALEAEILDIALILHMEHGGGNNSTFTTHVVSSSGTDAFCDRGSTRLLLKGPNTAVPTSKS